MEVGRVPWENLFIQWMPSISWSKLPFDYFNRMLPHFQAVQVPVPWDLTVHFRGNSSLTKDLLPFSAWANTVLDLPLFWSNLGTLDQHVNIRFALLRGRTCSLCKPSSWKHAQLRLSQCNAPKMRVWLAPWYAGFPQIPWFRTKGLEPELRAAKIMHWIDLVWGHRNNCNPDYQCILLVVC